MPHNFNNFTSPSFSGYQDIYGQQWASPPAPIVGYDSWMGYPQTAIRSGYELSKQNLAERLGNKFKTVVGLGKRAVKSLISGGSGNLASQATNTFNYAPSSSPYGNYSTEQYTSYGPNRTWASLGNNERSPAQVERARRVQSALDMGGRAIGLAAEFAPNSKVIAGFQAGHSAVNTLYPQFAVGDGLRYARAAARDTAQVSWAAAGNSVLDQFGMRRNPEARYGVSVEDKRRLAQGAFKLLTMPGALAGSVAKDAARAGAWAGVNHAQTMYADAARARSSW